MSPWHAEPRRIWPPFCSPALCSRVPPCNCLSFFPCARLRSCEDLPRSIEPMKDCRQFYIDGKWPSPAKTRDFEVINPANEEPIATISLGGTADVDRADEMPASPISLESIYAAALNNFAR